MNWFLEHLLAPIVVVAAVAAIPRAWSKVRDGAATVWQAVAWSLRRLAYWATSGTRERRDARFAKRVKAAQEGDIEMIGDAIDAHGLALSALHEVVITMLWPEKIGNGKDDLPKHTRMLAWFMLYRYLNHDTGEFDIDDTRSIAAYRRKHSDEAPGRWMTNLVCQSGDRLSTEFIDQMNGGPLRFDRKMNNGDSLNIKMVKGFRSKRSDIANVKCHVWVGSMWGADEGPELNLKEAWRRANDCLTIGGGWKDEKK